MKNVTLCAKWIGLVFAALVLAACSSNETKKPMRPRRLLQRRRSRLHKRRRSARLLNRLKQRHNASSRRLLPMLALCSTLLLTALR